MKKRFIRSRFPFVYNLIFNKRKSVENEIIRWYLLTFCGDPYQRAYLIIDTQCSSYTSAFHLSLYILMVIHIYGHICLNNLHMIFGKFLLLIRIPVC